MTPREAISIYLLAPVCAVMAFLGGYHLAPILRALGINP